MNKDEIITIDSFKSGFITTFPIYGKKVPLDFSPDCLNVYSDVYGILYKRLGYSTVNGTTATDAGNGIYNYRYDETTQYLVSMWAANFKKMDVVTSAWDGTWDPITVDSNKGTALADSLTYFSTYKGILIITQEDRAVPQRYYPGSGVVAQSNNLVDLDWEYSHGVVTGDVTTYTATGGDKLKITIDGTYIFDDIVMTGDASIDNAAASINAHSGFAARGLAYKDDSGYLAVVSNTRGVASVVLVEDGGTGNGGEAEDLFDATSAVTDTGEAGAPSAKHSCVWNNHAWLANSSTNPDRVWRSANGDYARWNSGTDYGNNDIFTDQDVGISGLFLLRKNMYACKRWSIHRYTYLGGAPLLDVSLTRASVGTASPRTIAVAEVPKEGELAFFLSTDMRIVKFDGTYVDPISDPIQKYNGYSNYCMIGDNTTYGINSAQLVKCHGVVYPERHWYVCYICLGDDTTPKDAFVYDYVSKSFWPFNYGVSFNASCISDNGAGQRKMYTQGTAFAYLQDTTNADVSTDITAYYITKKVGVSTTLTKMRQTNVITKSVACTPNIDYREDWNTSWVSNTLATATEDHNLGVLRMNNLLQFRIYDKSTDPAFGLLEISLLGDKMGRGV